MPDGTEEEGRSAAQSLNEPETREGADNIDSAEDELYHDWVGDACGLENSRAVVEEVVDAGPRLQVSRSQYLE